MQTRYGSVSSIAVAAEFCQAAVPRASRGGKQMIQRAFQHRSGRVISLSRFVLAAVFFLALYVDPTQPAKHDAWAYPLLLAYIAASAALMVASWNNWWVDYKFSRPAHALDVAVFSAAVFATEAYSSSFTSPFFTFFAFLLFSAIVRWGWRPALMTAAVATSLYVVIGLLGLYWDAADFNIYRFGRRATYLVLLSTVLIWFGVNQELATARRQPGDLEIDPEADAPPVRIALEYAQRRTDATRSLMVWWSREEPWMYVSDLKAGDFEEARFGPAESGISTAVYDSEYPFLFDVKHNRALISSPRSRGKLAKIHPPISPETAERFDLEKGLCVPVRAVDYEGIIFLVGVPGLCCEDLRIGKTIGEEISTAFDRFSIFNIAESSAVNETRLTIARDLHDSVAQVLAGASFRLEALRSWVKAGRDPDEEIVAVQEALRAEQRNIRSLIAKLRIGGESARMVDIVDSLSQISDELARQWGVECRFSAAPGQLEAPGWMLHELRQLTREGAANAVRHGSSERINVELSWTDHNICLAISGSSTKAMRQVEVRPASKPRKARPWSIHERVKNLGGTLSLSTTDTASKLTIILPRGEDE